MSAAVLIAVGAVLCFFGALSIRLAVVVAGFATCWLLSDALGASTVTTLVVSLAGAVVTLVVTILAAKFVLFIAGTCVGAVIGARIFVLADRGDHDWLLAIIFVPAVAVVAGFAAQHWQRPFVRWGTAFAGAALILAGIGRIGSGDTHQMWRPTTTAGAVVFAVLWVALTVLGHRVQRNAPLGRHRGRRARTA